jgi:ribose 5-phosphate isomerase B
MKKLITEKEIDQLIKNGKRELILEPNSLITPLAKDKIIQNKIDLIYQQSNNALKNKISCDKLRCYIGSDHTGVAVKKKLVDFIKTFNFEIVDVGTYSEDAVDYPDYAKSVALKVISDSASFGIILDATGIPSCITANKFKGIRAATCYNEFSARSSRGHNDANIIVLGAKSLGEETIKSILKVWFESEFLGSRHQKRLDKIKDIEENNFK